VTVLIFALGTIAAVCFYAAGYQHGRHRNTPAQAVSDGFWRGYWVGQRDGHAAAIAIERTPSPN
jgi:hypothetical protein